MAEFSLGVHVTQIGKKEDQDVELFVEEISIDQNGLWVYVRESQELSTLIKACPHEVVKTFRSHPPHSKCLACGARVKQKWVRVDESE